MAVDRSSYQAAGGFRDVPVRGVEDTEFGYRLQAAGCEQRLDRTGDIWHLGESTFAERLGHGEEDVREPYLNAYIPIWSRSLAERQRGLTTWSDLVVPFVAMPDGAEAIERLTSEFGRGAAVEAGAATSILDAPFAVAPRIDADTAGPATNAAFVAFRNGRCGEVIVVDEGREVGRFLALWAVNLAARREGITETLLRLPDTDMLRVLSEKIRTDFGLSILNLQQTR